MQSAPIAPDSLRRVLDTVFAAPAYDWVEPEHPFGWLQGVWFALVDFLAELRAAEPLLFRLGLVLLVGILLVILAHAGWIMLRTVRHAGEAAAPSEGAAVSAPRDAEWYERQADRLAREGRYADALQASFTALALRLDAAGLARYDPARTPREYARAAALAPEDRHRLQALVTDLYRHAFGGVPASDVDYGRWRALAREAWHGAAA